MTVTTTPPSFGVSASLYVGDLQHDIDEHQLLEIFQTVGPVASLKVCRDYVTRRSLGYAYVNYHFPPDAERALDLLNYKQMKGKPIRIMWSQRDPSLRKKAVANLFVKNLNKTIDSVSLFDTFATYGNIFSCKIATDINGESKGYAFVHYQTEEAAEKAIENLNGKLVEGKQIYVGKFIPSNLRSKNDEKWTNIFVKNLVKTIDQEKFQELFKPFGEITSAALALDEEGKSKGFGFVNFAKHDQAKKAVEEMNSREIDGQSIFVGRAQTKVEREKELKATFEKLRRERMNKYQGVNLFIKNLDEAIDDDQLREEFQSFGTITSAKVMKDEKSNFSKGFGFVCFSTPEEATKAITEMSGKMILNKPIYVGLAQRRDQRRQMLESRTMRIHPGYGMMPQGPMMFGPQGPQSFMYPPAQMMPRGRFMPNGRSAAFPSTPTGAPRNGMRNGNKQVQQYPGIRYNANVRNTQKPKKVEEEKGPAPTVEEQKQTLVESLYPLILDTLSKLNQGGADLAGKITGMIMEAYDPDELKEFVATRQLLDPRIDEALQLLKGKANAN